jgi:hypothetical protein
MAVKTYGATRNQVIAQALSSSITNLEGLQRRQSKVIDDLISDFLSRQKDFWGNLGDLGVDVFGSLIGGVMNGVADMISGSELIFNQFKNDVTRGNPNEVGLIENDIKGWTYALTNAFSRVFEGGQSFFGGALADTVTYGARFLELFGADVTKEVDKFMPAVRTVSMAKDDPLADLLNMYGKGGAMDNLSRFWTARRAEVLESLEFPNLNIPPINQDMNSDMRNERNQSIVEATYGEAFLKKQLDITNASSARREFLDNLFQNSAMTELIEQGGTWGEVGQFFRGVAQSVGRILPSMVISNSIGKLGATLGATGKAAAAVATLAKVAGNAYFSSSIFGMSMEEALKNGASYDDALTYAIGSAVSETAVESLSGYVIGDEMSVASFKELFIQAISEGSEEIIAELGSRGLAGYKGYVDKTTGEDIRQESTKDFYSRIFLSFLSGATSGALLGLPTYVQSRTLEGGAKSTTEALSQSIREQGAGNFAKGAAPRIQRTLSQLNSKRYTPAQKQQILENPYISRVISLNKDSGVYELTQTGQRIVDRGVGRTQDELLAMQGDKVISKGQYAISNNIFLEKIKEDIKIPPTKKGGKARNVKINVLTNKNLETLPQARKQEVKDAQKTFNNVVFVSDTKNNFNAFTDPDTGIIYVNVNSNKGIKNLYAHEVNDYLNTLYKGGKLSVKSAKAYEQFVKLFSNEGNFEVLLNSMPQEVTRLYEFVKNNYAKKDQAREFLSFIIQEILVSADGSNTDVIDALVKSKNKTALGFLRSFTDNMLLGQLTKNFAKNKNLESLLGLLRNRFANALIQSESLLREQDGIRLTAIFAASPMFSFDDEKDIQKFANEIASLENSNYADVNLIVEVLKNKNPMMKFIQMIGKNNQMSDFAAKMLVFNNTRSIFSNILKNMSISDMEVRVPSILNVLSKEKLIEYGFNEANLETYKTRPTLFKYIEKQLSSDFTVPTESLSAIENLMQALLEIRGIRFHKEGSKLRNKGYIFSNTIGAFSVEDFARVGDMLQNLGEKLYSINFSYQEQYNNFEGKFEFFLNEENQSLTYSRDFSITPSILDLDGNVVRKNPKMIYSSLSAVTLEQLVDTGTLPSQSFGIHNFGTLTSSTHQFAGVEYKYKEEYDGNKATFLQAEQVPLDEQFFATIVLKNSILRDTTFVGQRDMFTPTKVMNMVDKTKYKLKFDQNYETTYLSPNVQPLSKDIDITDEIQSFNLTMRYITQARKVSELTENQMDTTLGENVPAVQEESKVANLSKIVSLQEARNFLNAATLTNNLMKLRQNKNDLKYEIELANLGVANKVFLQKTNVSEVYQSTVESLEVIRKSIESDEMTFEQFLSVYRKIAPGLVSQIRDVFFEGIDVQQFQNNKAIQEVTKELSGQEAILFDRYSKEFASIVMFASLEEYQVNSIAEGQGTVKADDVSVITLTRVVDSPKRSKLYQKTLDWAKANNVRVVESILPKKSATPEEVNALNILLNNTNNAVKQKVLSGEDVLFSLPMDNDSTHLDAIQNANDISEKYPELTSKTLKKDTDIDTIVENVLDKYGIENYLNIYSSANQNFGDLTREEQLATGQAIKMFYKNFITSFLRGEQTFYGVNRDSIPNYIPSVALAIDTFMQIEFIDQLKDIREDLKFLRPFNSETLLASTKQILWANSNNLLTQDISLYDTFFGILRKDAIPMIAGMYQSYREATAGKQVRTFETKYGGVGFTAFKQVDNVTSERLEQLAQQVFSDSKELIYDFETEQLSSVGDNFKPSHLEDILKRENIENFSNLRREINFKSQSQRERSLYELGYDYAIYSTDKSDNNIIYAFKASDFHVGENAIAKNIQFNFDGVAPHFTYDVIDFSKDGLVRYRTSVRVTPSIVTKGGRVIENPVYIEAGIGAGKLETILSGKPITNQSTSISSITDINNYIYSYEDPTSSFGFNSVVRMSIQVDPSIIKDQGAYEGNTFYRSKTISERVDFFTPTTKDMIELLKEGQELSNLSQESINQILVAGVSSSVARIVNSKSLVSRNNPFQELDEFNSYLDMDSMIHLTSFIVAGGVNEYNRSKTISDIKGIIKATNNPKASARLNNMVESFYEVALTVANDSELVRKYGQQKVIEGFAKAVNDIYYASKGNYLVATSRFSNKAFVSDIKQKYEYDIRNVAKVIDLLPYNFNNFNETAFTKLPSGAIRTIVMKIYGPLESYNKVLESEKFKEVETRAKELGIKIKPINMTNLTQELGIQNEQQLEQVFENLQQEGIDVKEVDKGTLAQLKIDFLSNAGALLIKSSEQQVKKEVIGDLLDDDSPIMFSKPERIKKSNAKKARERIRGTTKVEVQVPPAFEKTPQEVEAVNKTRTKVSKVNFDTEYGRFDKSIPLVSLLTKVTKQLRFLIETQRGFGKEYQAEGAVFTRAIQRLNKIKKELEVLLKFENPVRPFDPNLDADTMNNPIISQAELFAYRDEVVEMGIAKQSTDNITSKIEQKIFQAIGQYEKEAIGTVESTSEEQSIARPADAALDPTIFEKIKDTPSFKLLMSLLKSYEYIQVKVLDSFFIGQKPQLKSAVAVTRTKLQNSISLLMQRANFPAVNPFSFKNTPQYRDALPTISKDLEDAIQKAMYDMTSDEALKTFSVFNEAVEKFKGALEQVNTDAQTMVLQNEQTIEVETKQEMEDVEEVLPQKRVERITRLATKGEIQYVYRLLLGQRLKVAEKNKKNAQTQQGITYWSRIYESTAIALSRAMRGEVKIPTEDLQIPKVKQTLKKLREEFSTSKEIPDLKDFVEDNKKTFVVTEDKEVVEKRRKQEVYEAQRTEEKRINTDKKKDTGVSKKWRDYSGPTYVAINDMKYSVGVNTPIGRVNFRKPTALSKGVTKTIEVEKITKTYSPQTKKAIEKRNAQEKVVEEKRLSYVKARKIKEKTDYESKNQTFKDKTEQAIKKAKQEYYESKDLLENLKRSADLLMNEEKTPPLKTTVGQKIYYKQGVEMYVVEEQTIKTFFRFEDANKWLNYKIHQRVLATEGSTLQTVQQETKLEQPQNSTQELAVINKMETGIEDEVEATPVKVEAKPQAVVPKAKQWQPTEDVVIEYNGVEYTYTLKDMQQMIKNGNWNYASKQDFVDYQVVVIEATQEKERVEQLTKQQQEATRAVLEEQTGSLNAPQATPSKKTNIFREIQATVLQLDPNHYLSQEKSFGAKYQIIKNDLQTKRKLSKGEKILLNLIQSLEQTIFGYATNDRVYNHVSMATGKVIVLWLDKFYRGTRAKGKIRVPSKAELKDLENQVVQSIFGALNYVDSELRVDINKTEQNPNGYLYWKAPYWFLRDMMNVTKWDVETTKAFANDSRGDSFRRLINAVRNLTTKGYGLGELIGSFKELDIDFAVKPITDMAIREEEGARTLDTAANQWQQNATENSDIGEEAGFNLRESIGTDFLDPYTVAEIVSLFQEESWGLALMRRIMEGQERMFKIDDIFDSTFDEKWVNKNRKELIRIQKDTVGVANLAGAQVPLSQVIYLRGVLFREIMRNRLIELGIIGGEKTFHFQNGGVVDLLAIRDSKTKAQDQKKRLPIVDSQALLLELTDIINNDSFAKSYSDKTYQMIESMYPFINERFKEIHGANLVNDGKTLERELPNLSQTQKQKLEALLPKGMTLEDASKMLYIPFLMSDSNYFKPNKLSFKDVLNIGVFDGLTEKLSNTTGVASIESITNVLNTYRQEVRNYYGLHRIMRDLNMLLNYQIKVGNNTSTIQSLLPEWAIEYFEKLLVDMAGYGVVDSPALIKKWLPVIRRNFYVASLGFNVKVIFTQFATLLNLWQIYGYGNPAFLTKMIANMAKRATPQNKAKLEAMLKDNLTYKDRQKGGTFEVGEATKEGVRGKTIIETLKEFSMKGIQLTDNMINEGFYLTLLETVNPKTGNLFTKKEASAMLTMAIIRSQSNRQAISKAPLLRSKNELTRIFVKFMGEPMKQITQLASSMVQLNQIKKISKAKNKISQRAQGKVDAAKLRLQEERNKLQQLEAAENNPNFATEDTKVQLKIMEDRKLQERRVQEEERKVRQLEQSQQRIEKTVNNIDSQEKEARRLFRGRASAVLSAVTYITSLGVIVDLLRKGLGEDDEERDPDDTTFDFLLKKFGSKFLDEVIGMIPFVRDAYSTIFKGYDYGTIGEVRGVNTLMTSLNGMFRSLVEGENVNWNRVLYNFGVGLAEVFGIPFKSIERLVTTPLQYISEPTYYQYNNWIGGRDTDNQQLVEAIRDNDTAMISVIIDNKIAKRNILVHKEIKDEIKRLAGAGFSVSMTGIPDEFTDQGARVKLTNEQKKEFAEAYNQADFVIRKMFTSGQYRRLNDKYKARLIQAIYDYYYKYAKQDVLGIDTLSEDLTFVSLNQAYTYFIGRAEAYRNMQLKDRERNTPTIIA